MSKRKPIPKMTPPAPPPIEDLLDPPARLQPLPTDEPEPTAKPKTETRQPVKTERQKNRKPPVTRRIAAKKVEESVGKSKCTYYIPTELAERIDLAHAQARVYTRNAKHKASKSEFIEAALTYALDEFDRNGRNADVTDRLAELLAASSR